MKLVTGSAENLKPQLVMEAFCKYLGYDYDPMGFQYHRLETYLKKDGELQPLGSVGWEITEEKHPDRRTEKLEQCLKNNFCNLHAVIYVYLFTHKTMLYFAINICINFIFYSNGNKALFQNVTRILNELIFLLK